MVALMLSNSTEKSIVTHSRPIYGQLRKMMITSRCDPSITTLIFTRRALILAREFEIKDLGELKYFLYIEVARSKIRNLLFPKEICAWLFNWDWNACIVACQPVETLIEMNHKLREYMDQVPTNKQRYQRLWEG